MNHKSETAVGALRPCRPFPIHPLPLIPCAKIIIVAERERPWRDHTPRSNRYTQTDKYIKPKPDPHLLNFGELLIDAVRVVLDVHRRREYLVLKLLGQQV